MWVLSSGSTRPRWAAAKVWSWSLPRAVSVPGQAVGIVRGVPRALERGLSGVGPGLPSAGGIRRGHCFEKVSSALLWHVEEFNASVYFSLCCRSGALYGRRLCGLQDLGSPCGGNNKFLFLSPHGWFSLCYIVVAMAVKELPPLVWRTSAEGHVALSEEGAVAPRLRRHLPCSCHSQSNGHRPVQLLAPSTDPRPARMPE
jgi:hypothetical protein